MKADTITKDYVKDTVVFADIFNYYVYGGKQVIKPEQLTERDSTKLALPYGADSAVVPVQKFRDVQKLYAAMTDGKIEYILYGVENQTETHYAMAVKSNLYDALEYAGQVEEAAKSHRRAMKLTKEKNGDTAKTLNTGEFLSGFWKEDRLIPSITLTISFNSEIWDGPLSLFDMMDAVDPSVLACINNYKVHLIAPAQMTDNEISKFQSSFREVMFFIKYSKDKKKLTEILESNKTRFQNLERRAADVIKIITNSRIKYKESEKVIDVCQAIQDMLKESELIGEERGEERGELKKSKETAQNLYELGVDINTIAKGVNHPLDIVKQWLGLLSENS